MPSVALTITIIADIFDKQGEAAFRERERRAVRRALDRPPAVLATGESPADKQLAADELAAYTAMAGLVLNLDEAIHKE